MGQNCSSTGPERCSELGKNARNFVVEIYSRQSVLNMYGV